MIHAAAKLQVPSLAPQTFSDITAALDGDYETESGTGRHDSWLVSFIDILILLLTLFVLLLTYREDRIGPIDDKAGQGTADAPTQTVTAAESFTTALEPPLLYSFADAEVELFHIEHELNVPSPAKIESSEAVEAHPPTEDLESAPETPASPATDDTAQSNEPLTTADTDSVQRKEAQLQEDHLQPATDTSGTMPTSRKPMEELLDAFSNSELQDRVEVRVMGAGLNIEIRDNIMFPPASAALTPDGISLLQTLAEALTAQPYQLSIEGHSDNVPIETTRFPSNWELSTARAAVVARHLVKRGISAERIRAIGYADTRPRADNVTPEGRSRNRRVSLVVQIPSRHN
jgi:chemotaxis protein MotB